MSFEFVNLYLSTILPPIILGVIIWKTDRFQEPAHLLLASFLIGFAIGRLLSIGLDGKPNKLIVQGLVFELVLGAANIFCLVTILF